MLRICKNFEIIYSSSERSVQFLVPECFFRTDNLEQLEFKFVGKLGFRNMQEKLENGFEPTGGQGIRDAGVNKIESIEYQSKKAHCYFRIF